MKSISLPKLSGNALKMIAAVTMLIDHVGMLLFPRVDLLRIIGRLSFPIFAFFIAEGCRHTKNKLRYFLTVASAGILFQTVYYLFSRSMYMNIFITFALAILMIYAMQNLQRAVLSEDRVARRTVLSVLIFAGAVLFVYMINQQFTISYGFAGCMVPVFGSVFMIPGECDCSAKRFDTTALHVLTMGIGLVYLSHVLKGSQMYSLFALPLLLLYSGKRGKLKMKYFFYIFYPVHLVVLQWIYMLIK